MANPSDLVPCYKAFFSNYTNFEGRARRAEYWWPCLINGIICSIPWVGWFYALIILVPTISLAVRRLHDIGKSGWLYLLVIIPIVNLILIFWFIKEGDSETNQYGENPKME